MRQRLAAFAPLTAERGIAGSNVASLPPRLPACNTSSAMSKIVLMHLRLSRRRLGAKTCSQGKRGFFAQATVGPGGEFSQNPERCDFVPDPRTKRGPTANPTQLRAVAERPSSVAAPLRRVDSGDTAFRARSWFPKRRGASLPAAPNPADVPEAALSLRGSIRGCRKLLQQLGVPEDSGWISTG